MKLEWLNEDFTRAKITVTSDASRWYRRRYVTAEVERVHRDNILDGYASWLFVAGGDRVCDHDDYLAQNIERKHRDAIDLRKRAAKEAKLKNPWSPVEPLPPARTVKR